MTTSNLLIGNQNVSLKTFLKTSPALSLALKGDKRYTKQFKYTMNDLAYINSQWEKIWDELETKSFIFTETAIKACAHAETLKNFQYHYPLKKGSVVRPSEDELRNHFLPLVKKSIVITTCFFGIVSAYDLINNILPNRFAIAGLQTMGWMDRLSTMAQKEIDSLQIAAITNFIGILAVYHYPQQRYSGAFQLLRSTDMCDNEIREEFFPRLMSICDLNPAQVLH